MGEIVKATDTVLGSLRNDVEATCSICKKAVPFKLKLFGEVDSNGKQVLRQYAT